MIAILSKELFAKPEDKEPLDLMGADQPPVDAIQEDAKERVEESLLPEDAVKEQEDSRLVSHEEPRLAGFDCAPAQEQVATDKPAESGHVAFKEGLEVEEQVPESSSPVVDEPVQSPDLREEGTNLVGTNLVDLANIDRVEDGQEQQSPAEPQPDLVQVPAGSSLNAVEASEATEILDDSGPSSLESQPSVGGNKVTDEEHTKEEQQEVVIVEETQLEMPDQASFILKSSEPAVEQQPQEVVKEVSVVALLHSCHTCNNNIFVIYRSSPTLLRVQSRRRRTTKKRKSIHMSLLSSEDEKMRS